MSAVLHAGMMSGPAFLAAALGRAARGGVPVGVTSAEVVPGLRIGPWPTAQDLASADVVVNLHGAMDAPSSNCFVWAITDGALPDLVVLHAVGRFIADLVRGGRRVLVHCHEGLNRSGLVCGVALVYLGFSGTKAVSLIREERGPYALSNRTFRAYLANLPPAIQTDSAATRAARGAAEHVVARDPNKEAPSCTIAPS